MSLSGGGVKWTPWALILRFLFITGSTVQLLPKDGQLAGVAQWPGRESSVNVFYLCKVDEAVGVSLLSPEYTMWNDLGLGYLEKLACLMKF